MKFIHTSDWQLGMTRWFLEADGGEAQARFAEDRLQAIDRIGELATTSGAEFIVVAGDVFDSNTMPEQTFQRALERIRSLPVPVYLLPGNHDALDASSIYHRAAFTELADDSVVVIRDSTPLSPRPGVELIGIPVRSKFHADDEIGLTVSELEATSGIRLIVGHGQVEGFGQDTGSLIDMEAIESAIARGAIHYLALGDSHSSAQLDRSGRVWFSGAHETTAFDDRERDSGNVLIVEISEEAEDFGAVTVTPHPVGQWRFMALDREFATFADAEHFLEELDTIPAKTTAVVKYSLLGTVTLQESTNFEARLATLSARFAALFPRRSATPLTVVPTDGDIDELGLTGYPLAAAQTLRKLSQGGTEAVANGIENPQVAAADALRLLARLAGTSLQESNK